MAPAPTTRSALSRAMRSLLPALLGVPAAGQTTYFEVTSFRSPSQCERMQCLSSRREECREHLKGFYLKEKGCPSGEICTDCVQGNGSQPTLCRCERPPYSVPVDYGQACNIGQVCTAGMCFRPCNTYLHPTLCEPMHCVWEPFSRTCQDKPPPVPTVYWRGSPAGLSPLQQGNEILAATQQAAFPISYHQFLESAVGYRIQGRLITNITRLDSLFLKLDGNNDGGIDADEYKVLPSIFDALNDVVTSEASSAGAPAARRLQAIEGYVTPEVCGAQQPRMYYCSFDQSCKSDCKECGWKGATDRAFSTCVRPTPLSCHADGHKVFCPSDELCHPPADCSECVDRPIVDHGQHMCVALWWSLQPLPQWTNWVCRDRNKVGMPCRFDQDCIYGLRRCLNSQCQPFQPYNPNQTCANDFDCPHQNYYCPADPTGGYNPYWVQYCRQQRGEGMTCKEDRECSPELRCNVEEPQPRCRRLFSLSVGTPAADDTLCEFGWRDRDNKCAPAAQSKEAGRDCDSDFDCATTDKSGRTGLCVCKAWWESGDAKYCMPVAGDYENYQAKLRAFASFKAINCGSFWTEDECLRVFGNEALRLKLEVDCETQLLSKGPHLPPADCGIHDEERFPDACARLANLR